jgi:hypothetical protein
MNTAEIPSQTLNEAYHAIAERREVNPAALDRQTVDEAEFMAALAYVLGIPLVEPADLTEGLLAECGILTAELEPAALMEYKFVPLARRGETLVVISSCPWDPITTEVLLGYFQQCSQIKFALASPQCLQALFDHLQKAQARNQVPAAAGYVPKPLPAKGMIAQSPGAAPASAVAPAAGIEERTPSVVMPPGTRPPVAATIPASKVPPATAPAAVATGIGSPAQPAGGAPLLTQEDIAHLINVLALELQRLLQQKTRRSL